MARTYFSRATHAILGTQADGARGILHWHDNEFDAHRDAKEINRQGGNCRVISAPNGDLNTDNEKNLRSIIGY